MSQLISNMSLDENFDEDEKTELESIKENITDNLSILIEKKLDLFSSTVNNK